MVCFIGVGIVCCPDFLGLAILTAPLFSFGNFKFRNPVFIVGNILSLLISESDTKTDPIQFVASDNFVSNYFNFVTVDDSKLIL